MCKDFCCQDFFLTLTWLKNKLYALNYFPFFSGFFSLMLILQLKELLKIFLDLIFNIILGYILNSIYLKMKMWLIYYISPHPQV